MQVFRNVELTLYLQMRDKNNLRKKMLKETIRDEKIILMNVLAQNGIEGDVVGQGIALTCDIDNNLFLDEMIHIKRVKTEEILQSVATGSSEGLQNETQQTFKERAIDEAIDSD